jgi:hypothetical protein
MNNKLSKIFSRRLKTKLVFLIFSVISILLTIDASNSLDHLRFFQGIGLSIGFLAGFLDGSFAEKNITSIKDLLCENEEIHIAVWWLSTIGFWLFFGATIILFIRYISTL